MKHMLKKSSIGDRDRYSRLTYILKLTLPAMAGLIIVMSFVFSKSSTDTPPKQYTDSSGLDNMSIIDLKYIRKDGKLPFQIEASAARENDDEQFVIEDLQAQAKIDKKKAILIKSKKGILDKSTQKLDLKDGVHLTYNNGIEFYTPEVQFDLQSGNAESSHVVRGSGPFGRIQSQGMKISEDGKKIHFTGKSQMQLQLSTKP